MTGGTLNVPVVVSHLPDVSTTFGIEVVAGSDTTAGSGDYSITTSSVTFGPDDADLTENLVVTITDDAVEEDETIKLKIVDADSPVDDVGDHYTRHAMGGTATVTINSEDVSVPVAQWAQAAYSVTETDADQELEVTVNFAPALTGATALTIGQTGGDAAASGTNVDWAFKPGTVCVAGAMGDTSASCILVIKGDNIVESAETIELTISAVLIGDATIGAQAVTTVTITDDDAPPAPSSVTLSVGNASVAENVGSVTVTATLNNAAGSSGVSVSVTAGDMSTATATADYTGLPATISIGNGATTGTATLTIVNDDVDEDNETIVLTATSSGLTVTGTTLTITDDDTAGVTVSKSTLGPVAGATDTYTVVLDTKPTHSVTITPTSGTPAKATVSGAVTFTTTNWQTPQTVTVTGVAAGSSTITHAASGSDAKYGSSLTIDSVDVTVAAAELPTVSFEAASYEVREPGTGNITFTLRISCSSGSDPVYLGTMDAGATFGSDYRPLTWDEDTESFAALCNSHSGIYIYADNVLERRPEPFKVTIKPDAAYQLGDITETTVWIFDANAPETLTINGAPEKTSSTITVKWDYPPYKFPNITETLIWVQNAGDDTENVYKTSIAPDPPPDEQSATITV